MTIEYKWLGKSHILYDGALIDQVDDSLFDPEYWRRAGLIEGGAVGRGNTLLVSHGDQQLVLRHYRRGGVPARLSADHYLWLGLGRSRPWREFALLDDLHRRGFPVPAPVAARVVREGPLYRGDLITRRIAAEPMAERVSRRRLSLTTLDAIGRCLRRFHDAGVYHADLNARNILLGEPGEVYLIDFDRGSIRRPRRGWQQANLQRLRRSLNKLAAQQSDFCFDDEDWRRVLAGYQAQVSRIADR